VPGFCYSVGKMALRSFLSIQADRSGDGKTMAPEIAQKKILKSQAEFLNRLDAALASYDNRPDAPHL